MFSGIIRTSVRTNRSPILRKIKPYFWNILVSDAKLVMQSFVDWLETLVINFDKNSSKNPKIMLVAHYGVSFDHSHVLRTMLKHGIQMPEMFLLDLVVMFKKMMGKKRSAKLAHSREKKYVP